MRRALLQRSDIFLSARGASLTLRTASLMLRTASLVLNRYFLCHKSSDIVHEGRIPFADRRIARRKRCSPRIE